MSEDDLRRRATELRDHSRSLRARSERLRAESAHLRAAGHGDREKSSRIVREIGSDPLETPTGLTIR
jgi:hypothetical protein